MGLDENLKIRSRGKGGFSLLELVLASAVTSLIALSIPAFLVLSARGQKMAFDNQAIDENFLKLQKRLGPDYLADETNPSNLKPSFYNCTCNFKGLTIDPNDPNLFGSIIPLATLKPKLWDYDNTCASVWPANPQNRYDPLIVEAKSKPMGNEPFYISNFYLTGLFRFSFDPVSAQYFGHLTFQYVKTSETPGGQATQPRLLPMVLTTKTVGGIDEVTDCTISAEEDGPPVEYARTSIFWATGTTPWTVPPNVRRVYVRLFGGGGGGGGASSNCASGGGGGGGGGSAGGTYRVTPGRQIAVIVGAGGARGDKGQNGASGGFSKFLSAAAKGGQGGHSGNGNRSGGGGGRGGPNLRRGFYGYEGFRAGSVYNDRRLYGAGGDSGLRIGKGADMVGSPNREATVPGGGGGGGGPFLSGCQDAQDGSPGMVVIYF